MTACKPSTSTMPPTKLAASNVADLEEGEGVGDTVGTVTLEAEVVGTVTLAA